MKTPWLVVGAGFTGAVLAERLASQLGQKVVVIDKRQHIGGNAFDEVNEAGHLVHRYGPHIFHTNSQKVWDYLSHFTSWRPYEHQVLAMVDGRTIPVPFNLDSIEACFPPAKAQALIVRLIAGYGEGAKVPILKLRESDDAALAELGAFIYEKIFYHYTLKQWERTPDALDPSVTARVPVYVSRDARYFQDTYQAMPAEGYTAMFRRMLDHPNIELRLGCDCKQCGIAWDRMIYTGPIDAFFDYQHGVLPYRSLRFDFVTKDVPCFQETGTVNYPNEHAFTRITEMKYLTGQSSDSTTVIYEYPQAYNPAQNEPYYPIPCADSHERLRPYMAMAEALKGKVFFAGRLADYQYYNMDQAVARALALFEKEIRAAL